MSASPHEVGLDLRATSDASRGEQFSLWALRTWWQAFPEVDAAWPELVRGFRACQVPLALESCHRLCSVLLASGGCGAALGCPCCPGITPGEEILLDVLRAAAGGEESRVLLRLRRFAPAAMARLAAPHAIRFARQLHAAGLSWPNVSPDSCHVMRLVPTNTDRLH
ncbi:MAG TPA: hypothetical protein VMF52_09625 [Steroidobacteraceae bacterium]|nr:hypothetical protein [Steroidobacteraceae bacterium]